MLTSSFWTGVKASGEVMVGTISFGLILLGTKVGETPLAAEFGSTFAGENVTAGVYSIGEPNDG